MAAAAFLFACANLILLAPFPLLGMPIALVQDIITSLAALLTLLCVLWLRPRPNRKRLRESLGVVRQGCRSSLTTSNTVRSLAYAVDIRDRYIHSHSRAVSALSAAIARHMGLGAHEVRVVAMGGLLHDIGKIGVPDTILTKNGSLTEEEWEIIRQHPLLGKAIVEQASELRPVVPLVLHHQERYDGTGYPKHLKGEEIPLGARIIAAADAYHAIRSDRPYRQGRSHAEAVPELLRCVGTQFDPKVVKALFEALETDEELRSVLEIDEGGSVIPFPSPSRASFNLQ